MKKIIITGANGFVGSYVIEQALADGYEVWAAVRRGADLRYLTDERIHLLYLDYADEEGMRQIFTDLLRTEGPLDGVIHCAGATKCRHLADFQTHQHGIYGAPRTPFGRNGLAPRALCLR